ncbi:C-terminal processing peptidase [Spongiibacter sp. IMCC21906]|uniref:S41 family peptidase n=1 Tax=Spongiibacter sp. IMCC21906 TaxID=1620392 RepID=UPI00062DE7C9|nr:S41 family peptidase [Spongiibacter sp. IMCC21906]AKH68513.1 C-terminal processing peptidase [Spongiibacter sp. IMCC21906]
MRESRRFSAITLLTLSLLAPLATWAQDQSSAQQNPEEQGQLPLQSLRNFADVFNQIRQSYVEEVDDETLLENAIRGMLSGLDPHSDYLDEESFEDLQSHTTGEFGGLGIEVGMENGFVKVIAPIDDTPAEKAGIQPGDLIIQIDNKPIKGLNLQEAVTMMRGPKGSKIILTILRNGKNTPFDVELKRDIITVASVRSEMLEPGYGYIRISQFQNRTGADARKELAKLHAHKEELQGLVLDLRNNPGGLLQASVQLVDLFLNEGLIVYTEGRLPNAYSRFMAGKRQPADETPMVVLINGGSASASEIVAGALQDHRRAVIMGTQSFGKGSVQTVLPLSEKSAIKLTTARYYTPGGRSIQAQGIIPDIFVERAKVETLRANKQVTEADLAGHLGADKGEESTGASRVNGERNNKLAEDDNQLYEALNLLKGLHFMSKAKKAVPNMFTDKEG